MDRSQAQKAAQDLAASIRAFAAVNAMPELEEAASIYDGIASAGRPLEGDYDVLVARKLRSLTDLFRSGAVWERETLQSKLHELMAELREAVGAPNS